MKKVWIALLLVAALLTAACSGSTVTSTDAPTQAPTQAVTTQAPTDAPPEGPSHKISEEPVTLKAVKVEGASARTRSSMWLFAKLAQTTNVTLDVERIEDSVWPERKNLLFASRELPDMIRGSFSDAEWASFLNAKQLRPVQDLLDYMPNYSKELSQYTPEERMCLYDAQGNMKGFFTGQELGVMAIPGARAIINQKWLDDLNLQMPTNFEEFYDVLCAFRDNDCNGNGQKDEIPLGGYSSGYGVDYFIACPLGISVTWSAKSDWVEVDGDIEYLYTNERYRVYLEQMNLLYSEGLLDSEYYTQSSAEYLAKGANMQIGACTAAAPFVLTGTTDKEVYGQYTGMVPMRSEYSEPKKFFNRLTPPGLFFTSSTEESGNLEVAAKLVDFFWTEEYATYLYGPEKGSEILGDWDGQGGVVWNEDRTSWVVEVPEQYNGIYEYVVNEVSGNFYWGIYDRSEYWKKWDMVEEDKELVKIFEDCWQYVVPGFPPSLSFTTEEQEEIALIESELKTYVSQMEAKFVMGEEKLDDTSWEAFQNHLKSMDVDVLVDVYKAAYGRYLEALKNIG